MRLFPILICEGIRWFFCSDRCRDNWYLRLRDPQSPRYNETMAMKDFELAQAPVIDTSTRRCDDCGRVLNEVGTPVL